MLQQFDGQITGRVVLGDMLIGFQVFLDVGNTVLNLMTVVDVDMSL